MKKSANEETRRMMNEKVNIKTGAEVGLTGGMGSGKSTVGKMLVDLGARLVDADLIVRRLQEPGEPVFQNMVEHFGEKVVLPDGTLDRKAVAAVVFNDPAELEALNGMVHPPLREEMERMRQEYLAAGEKVVVDFPLLVESGYKGFAGVIVVDSDLDTVIERLVSERGFSREDALARIGQQASREERLAVADFVIENNADLATLEKRVKECWDWICTLA